MISAATFSVKRTNDNNDRNDINDPKNDIIRGFYESLLPNAALIEVRDDKFFYQPTTNIWAKNSSQFQLFNKLNIYWEVLNADNRKVVWDYLQLLFGASRELCGMR